MKPGQKNLYNFLLEKQDNKANLEEVEKIFRTKKTIVEKWSKIYPKHFCVMDNYVLIPKDIEIMEKKTKVSNIDNEEFRTQRQTIVKDLRKMLIGPFDEKECLDKGDIPMSKYLSGKLVPIGSTSRVVNEEENNINTNELIEGESVDEIILNRDPFRPSSMGISFQITDLIPMSINVRWGMYNEENKRTQMDKKISVIPNKIKNEYIIENNGELEEPALVKIKVKKSKDIFNVSIFLINRYKRKEYPKQTEVMFQTYFKVILPKQYLNSMSLKTDQSNFSDELLFSYVKEYVKGHGVSAKYTDLDDKYCYLETEWLPHYEIPSIKHKVINNNNYDMMELAKMSKKDLISSLLNIPENYNNWLEDQTKKIDDLPEHLKAVANKNIEDIKMIIRRINEGILCLNNEEKCLQAFRFANEVMSLQRKHSIETVSFIKTGNRYEEPLNGKWRLFQIAFILMNITGVSNIEHVDRGIVDLLWFPTGGGKTEAYLGIAAYTMGLRRLNGIWDKPETYVGISIMMRYTLRLLTVQQFQRATTMICAAESIRRRHEMIWGTEPFRIGLWVGQASTPNSFEDAINTIKDIRENNNTDQSNPMQLQYCPWCGEILTINDYEIYKKEQKIICSNKNCIFHNEQGIPALTVDEAIYNNVPTMLIGTVDKIAQIAWNPRIRELFGRKNHYNNKSGFTFEKNKKVNCSYLLPPDLIIQDELHLISGPLGSLTGLYEIAIDYLSQRNCNGKSIGPKIIASTATIKGAEDQIKKLFNRGISQFPCAAIDIRDNFFSSEVPITEKPGRLYIGICSPGVSGKIHTVYTYSALLSIIRNYKDKSSLDPYWTLLGYFNTLKELSGTSMLLKDEIPIRLKLISESKNNWSELKIEEMTSRMQASDIPKLLGKMEKTITDENVIDVVQATNMISVGVDIERLGLMVVHNQPKTVSEYIQATSRVGRKYPGIVITLFNSLRARDLSHFEGFIAFHEALYKYVEPTSVTTFSVGARDRGLTGLIVGMTRQSNPNIGEESMAKNFIIDDVSNDIMEFILSRVDQNMQDEIREEIISNFKWWENRAKKYSDKLYYGHKQYVKNYLIKQYNEKTKDPDVRPALNSLRSVESEILVYEVTKYENVIGKLRPSQLINYYGPGSIVDLLDKSVMILAADSWGFPNENIIEEPRLQNHLKISKLKLIGGSSKYMKIKAVTFPRWRICPACGIMSNNIYDKYCYYCERDKGKKVKLYPSRFIVVCEQGHINDFPWIEWVHRGIKCSSENPKLKYQSIGRSGSLSDIRVTCLKCGKSNSLANIMDEDELAKILPNCKGESIWLGNSVTNCSAKIKTSLRAASTLYSPLVTSVLSIPLLDEEENLINKVEKYREGINNLIGSLGNCEEERKIICKMLSIDESFYKQIIKIINHEDYKLSYDNIRNQEWNTFIKNSNNDKENTGFISNSVELNKNMKNYFKSIIRVDKLKEIRVMQGFTRLHYPDPFFSEIPKGLKIMEQKQDWLPAIEVCGEGIFFRFDYNKIIKWENNSRVKEEAYKIFDKYNKYRESLKYEKREMLPRNILIHSFSHMMMKELAFYSGYATTALRERIYCGDKMMGVLIYTASSDSEGSLGGLIELTNYKRMGSIFKNALSKMEHCSSDPLCVDREYNSSINGAACHACMYVSETSCELNNQLLDRRMLSPLLGYEELSYFKE
ncbi:MAG: DISARM system helicase DrmA [Clostridiaceae bacterium]